MTGLHKPKAKEETKIQTMHEYARPNSSGLGSSTVENEASTTSSGFIAGKPVFFSKPILEFSMASKVDRKPRPRFNRTLYFTLHEQDVALEALMRFLLSGFIISASWCGW